jgi:hypothetical protein
MNKAAVVLTLMLVAEAAANMYDVVEDTKVPPLTCTGGCATWTSLGSETAFTFAIVF